METGNAARSLRTRTLSFCSERLAGTDPCRDLDDPRGFGLLWDLRRSPGLPTSPCISSQSAAGGRVPGRVGSSSLLVIAKHVAVAGIQLGQHTMRLVNAGFSIAYQNRGHACPPVGPWADLIHGGGYHPACVHLVFHRGRCYGEHSVRLAAGVAPAACAWDRRGVTCHLDHLCVAVLCVGRFRSSYIVLGAVRSQRLFPGRWPRGDVHRHQIRVAS